MHPVSFQRHYRLEEPHVAQTAASMPPCPLDEGPLNLAAPRTSIFCCPRASRMDSVQ